MTIEIVTMIGSSRFRKAFVTEGAKLEKSGVLVLAMTFFSHSDGISVSKQEREILRKVDRYRIDLANRIHVINDMTRVCISCAKVCESIFEPKHGYNISICCGKLAHFKPYIGEDTQYEIEYSTSKGKVITYMN